VGRTRVLGRVEVFGTNQSSGSSLKCLRRARSLGRHRCVDESAPWLGIDVWDEPTSWLGIDVLDEPTPWLSIEV